MKRKMICIGIISLFLLAGINSISADSIKRINSNAPPLLAEFTIEVHRYEENSKATFTIHQSGKLNGEYKVELNIIFLDAPQENFQYIVDYNVVLYCFYQGLTGETVSFFEHKFTKVVYSNESKPEDIFEEVKRNIPRDSYRVVAQVNLDVTVEEWIYFGPIQRHMWRYRNSYNIEDIGEKAKSVNSFESIIPIFLERFGRILNNRPCIFPLLEKILSQKYL